MKEEYKAKDEESRFFMNELARYKEQYDERLVQRLTDQIDSLKLDITLMQMKVQESMEEASQVRAENFKLKTDVEMRQVEEIDEQIN